MMKKRLLTALFAIIMMITTYPVYASSDMERIDFGIGFDQTFMIPDYSAVPDDYDEYGNPIFYVMVHPDIWAETFIYHPFFLGLTPYEDATFMLEYDDPDRMQALNDWCPSCGSRSVVPQTRSVIAPPPQGSLGGEITCPSAVVIRAPGNDFDFIQGTIFETRNLCRNCGWASAWWHDPFPYRWNWRITCHNGPTFTVVLDASVSRGHNPHQAASARFAGVVHGFNCRQFGCTRPC
jgi:hypothetical protein